MHFPRTYHSATLLTNGKVLVAGGQNNSAFSMASAEAYNPKTGTWSFTGGLSSIHTPGVAILLHNGEVLVAGGSNSSGYPTASAELYSPKTGKWRLAVSMTTARDFHAAFLLENGGVLVAGGESQVSNFTIMASAEIYLLS